MTYRSERLRLVSACLLGIFLTLAEAQVSPAAQPLTPAEVALLDSPQRQRILEEGARKEGKAVWYTPLIVNQAVRPLKEAFEKKYPFITVDFHRANSRGLVQKWFSENTAKRYQADVVGGSEVTMLGKKAGLLLRIASPSLRDYPAELKDAQGYWSTTNLYFMTLAYNTGRIKPNEAPKTYDDILQPKWKGRMAWHMASNTGTPLFIGNIISTLGEKAGTAYLQNLAKQNVISATASARGIVDLVVAGEYDIAINIFNNHAEISKNAGAPVDWQPLEPVPSPIGDYRRREERAAAPCRDVVHRFSFVRRRAKSVATCRLSAGPSKGRGKNSGAKTRRRPIREGKFFSPGHGFGAERQMASPAREVIYKVIPIGLSIG